MVFDLLGKIKTVRKPSSGTLLSDSFDHFRGFSVVEEPIAFVSPSAGSRLSAPIHSSGGL